MLATLKAMRSWPLLARLGVVAVALAAAYLFQIPLEREVPGEPFLLFFLIVAGAALAFGRPVGLLAAGLSTLLSPFFFEPSGSLFVLHAADLVRVELYAVVAAGSVVGLDRLVRALIAADDAASRLARSEHANSLLLRELAHRVANNFASVASLIRRKADAVDDVDARTVLNEAVDQVMVLARVHNHLRTESAEACLDSKAFIEELCDDLRVLIAPDQPVAIECAAVSRRLSVAEAVPLGLIVNELVTNAIKYAFPDGRGGTVRVMLDGAGDRLCLRVEDDGVGLRGERAQGTGLGQDLVRALAQQLNGRLEVASASRGGGQFRVVFPGPKGADGVAPSPAAAMH